MTTTLESNFEIIFKHLTVDEIFLWTYNRNGIGQTIVQVHTHNKQRSSTLRERCERALLPMEGYTFTFYNTKDVQARINDGLGRLHLNCQPKNRIYVNPKPINTVILPEISSNELLEQTRAYIKREKDKIIAFMEGYHLYYGKEIYTTAAFMLHQALEISLRVAQKLLLGVEERSHSLKQNIDFFRPYDSVLSTLISTNEEKQAINRLTESYTGSRYKNNFIMDIQKIEFCKAIADRILLWIADYEQELLQEISDKFIAIQATLQQTDIIKTKIDMEKSTNINNNHRDLIHNALETYGQVHGLYCFAYVTRQNSMCNLLNVQQSHNEVHHYYLFAIMSNQNRPIMDLQNCVMQLLPEKIKVTLIQETLEAVKNFLKKHDSFQSNLLRTAECWYTKKELSIKETEQTTISKNIGYSKYLWSRRYQNANHLIGPWSGEGSQFETLDETCSYMLVLAIEQICLGLTKQFFDYTPSSTNLNYLLDLCDLIYPEAAADFQRNSLERKSLIHQLIKAQQKFRHSTTYEAKGKYLPELYQLTKSFIQKANDFVEAYFEQLTPFVVEERSEISELSLSN